MQSAAPCRRSHVAFSRAAAPRRQVPSRRLGMPMSGRSLRSLAVRRRECIADYNALSLRTTDPDRGVHGEAQLERGSSLPRVRSRRDFAAARPLRIWP